MLHFICAFLTEAKPLLSAYKLEKWQGSERFPIYNNKEGNITLTVSGMGKQSAAKAVEDTFNKLNCSKSDAWLNFGIVGHGKAKLGELFLAHSIMDSATQKKWYPQMVFDSPCKTADLISLDEPSKDYQDCLYDMEASGFYTVCMQYVTSELAHCIKVVSDTPENDFQTFDKQQAVTLIQQQLPNINKVCNELLSLSSEFKQSTRQPTSYDTIIEKWHFTESEKIQLMKLLQRWQVMQPNKEPNDEIAGMNAGKAVLKKLEAQLDSMTFSYD